MIGDRELYGNEITVKFEEINKTKVIEKLRIIKAQLLQGEMG